MLEILLGQIPEALYFALFMIFTKELKSKRITYTILVSIEYLLLLNMIPYSIWSHILYFVLSFIIMKLLYKDETQITDVFTLCIASIFLMITSMILYPIIWFTVHNMLVYAVLHRILLFIILILCRNKLSKINKLYYRFWNRNNKPKKVKSTTFRAINLIIFNCSFFIINLGIIFHNLYWR